MIDTFKGTKNYVQLSKYLYLSCMANVQCIMFNIKCIQYKYIAFELQLIHSMSNKFASNNIL